MIINFVPNIFFIIIFLVLMLTYHFEDKVERTVDDLKLEEPNEALLAFLIDPIDKIVLMDICHFFHKKVKIFEFRI